MRISIVTINYNNATGLERTIRSVQSQTYDNIEHIVIDGGSTDGSVDVIKSLSDKISYWISEPDKGIYNAMNKGTIQAHGEYCLFLNSGDALFSDTSLSNTLAKCPIADIVSADTVDNGDIIRGCFPAPNDISTAFMLQSSLPHPSTLIKTELFKKHLYKEDYKIISDWIFFFETLIINDASYQHIPVPLTSFYLDGISNTNKQKAAIEKDRYLKSKFSARIVKDIEDSYSTVVISSYCSGEKVKRITKFIIRVCQWLQRHKLLK